MEEEINELAVKQLLRGERPEGMPLTEFKIKRKAVQTFIKRKRKGRLVYLSKEFVTETDSKTGNKKEMVKTYKPYKKPIENGKNKD